MKWFKQLVVGVEKIGAELEQMNKKLVDQKCLWMGGTLDEELEADGG